ncbi:hypothetical protein BOTBODRAFT_169318 [Botryobasidium botryosum FD-172 SS1]|uniref:Proteasome activator Blm10 mid region domain-containing protein n=1 Tax=Botryobasidium botryosum (strain FD-172 SS1) TaxID=930990 RepID=A0A067N0U6_BOTB1|nr:hypothetical protein BOTBODRAFT_169318 [Botryobasidium botryosum FD-172 SS1]
MLSEDTPSESGLYEEDELNELKRCKDALPYECESVEAMQDKLQFIIGRLVMCADSRYWEALVGWDGALQCWLLLKYPMPRHTRAKLVRFYYELALMPGAEPRLVRHWVDMIWRLLTPINDDSRKYPINRDDLELPWEPLWKAMKKALYSKKGRRDGTFGPSAGTLSSLAEYASLFFPLSETENILNTILPYFTQDSYTTMITILVGFLPFKPSVAHLYVPALFSIWESFNSAIIEDRVVTVSAILVKNQMTILTQGKAEKEGLMQWKDVGVWTESEWRRLMRLCSGSMYVPIGAIPGTSATSLHADLSNPPRIKKSSHRYKYLAMLIVYSIFSDGPVKAEGQTPGPTTQKAYLAGSKALDSLDSIITSMENYFHPSNTGVWTTTLAGFLQRLLYEFVHRWREEEKPECATPRERRLTPAIRSAFVQTLKTPALLAMFSKDPMATALAQGALKSMSLLEPDLVMPDILERTYSGLETINETHRTTAVMSCLSGVTQTLITEKLWLGGQKHVIPLLDLCIPGIDLNDPIKTICTTLYITASVSQLMIGDMTVLPRPDHQNGRNGSDMELSFPEGTDLGEAKAVNWEEEDTLVRESTAGFADWVVSFFRRVFALFENLPEEGGRTNRTGGRTEESVLKAIKTTIDIVCMQLSDPMFDLALKLIYDYGTTNARANSVRAFGNLVASLARAKPEQTIAKFLPFCLEQIKTELEHGASSVRSTTTHAPIPSDTTFHWNLAIVRGILGCGGQELLKYKQDILELIHLLVEKTKSERGYSGSARLVGRVLQSLTGIYPLASRFVNKDEWEDENFAREHHRYWGKVYKYEEVDIEWHMPTDEEIAFAMEILDTVVASALDTLDGLLNVPAASRDHAWRNDFCRYTHFVRSSWAGLPNIILEFASGSAQEEEHFNTDTEVAELIVSPVSVESGFILTDPEDPRYQAVAAHRARFGKFLHRASVSLLQSEGEDHIEIVTTVTKGIDVYLLDYGVARETFATAQKNLEVYKEQAQMWAKQEMFPRMVWIKHAMVQFSARMYLQGLYRRRTELVDLLVNDLVDFSLSPYVRVRRTAQIVLLSVIQYFTRAARVVLSKVFDALDNEIKRGKDANPDRQKGALHLLWSKDLRTYALSYSPWAGKYLTVLLELQHQEKPSIQKLVQTLVHDSLPHLSEEHLQLFTYNAELPGVTNATRALEDDLPAAIIPADLVKEAKAKLPARIQRKEAMYDQTINNMIEVIHRPKTHWRYAQSATRYLISMLRKDRPPHPELAKIFLRGACSDHATMRYYSQRGITKLLEIVKVRTFSKDDQEINQGEGKNPLRRKVDPKTISFESHLNTPMSFGDKDAVCSVFIDKIWAGFIAWPSHIHGYAAPPEQGPAFTWEKSSQPVLQAIRESIDTDWFTKLAILWAQEGNRTNAKTDLRAENLEFFKSIFQVFEGEFIQLALSTVDSLWADPDKFKQRAAAEILGGIWRGSKHFSGDAYATLWGWITPHLPQIFSQMTPDTVTIWQNLISHNLVDRDPRRNFPIIEFITNLPLEFQGDSAFTMSKTLTVVGSLAEALESRFVPMSDDHLNTYFENIATGYAEIRTHIAQNMAGLLDLQWQPTYPSVKAFLDQCASGPDPLQIRKTKHLGHITRILETLAESRDQRLLGPRVSQSHYDKVGLTILQWIWTVCHSAQALTIFPYIMPLLPEMLHMAELQDSSELQMFSAGVLYILTAVCPPEEFVEPITDNFIRAVQSSPSWRIRLNTLPILQVFYFRNLHMLSDDCISRIKDVLCDCLGDANIEVREMAAATLSGFLRCSQRKAIAVLKDRFVRLARRTKLPPRQSPGHADALRILHSAILGLISLIDAYPYTVEKWVPPLIEILAEHSADPPPISTSIRKCAANFKKTHQDTWHTDQHLFNEDQTQALSLIVTGTSYYA